MDLLTFIVLIPATGYDSRKICESLEARVFTDIRYSGEIAAAIKKEYDVEADVWPITDFMDEFNNENIEQSDYFMSYVFSSKKPLHL